MSSKLKIKIGDVEIDYEGSEEFLKQELPQLLKTAMELHRAGGEPAIGSAGGGSGSASSSGGGKANVPSLTTGSIAAKLGVKSGSELVVAAAAHLALVKKLDAFSRKQLLAEMKGATAYYNKNYSTNLSSYLKSVVKDDQVSEISTGHFALTAKTRSELEKKLANA